MMSAMEAAPASPRRPGRLWLVALAVAIPLLVAIPTTVVLWSGQDHSVQPAPSAPSVPLFDRAVDATIFYEVDSVPLTTPTASLLEFLVESAPGQSAVSSDSDVLQPVPTPLCHVPPLCQLQQVTEFAFQARRPGTSVITFQLGAGHVVRKTVQVALLPQVARGRPAG